MQKNAIDHLNLSLNYLKVVDYNELVYENMSEEVKIRLKNYFEESELSEEEKEATLNEVINLCKSRIFL